MYGPDSVDESLARRGLKQEAVGGRIVPADTKPYAYPPYGYYRDVYGRPQESYPGQLRDERREYEL